jgi:hypothetical protein
MRRLLLVLSTAAVLACTVPAHAVADSTDDSFIASLDKAGITFNKRDQAVTAGRYVCELVGKGTKASEVVQDLRDANPKFTLDAATRFVGIAANAYCPDQLSPVGNQGGT